MRLKYAGLITILTFVNICDLAKSMKCYQCNSDLQPQCESDVSNDYLLECVWPEKDNATNTKNESTADIYCRKITQKLHFLDHNSYIVVRECAFKHGKPKCHKNIWPDFTVKSCSCKKEGCNASSGQSKNAIILIFCLLLLYFSPP